MASKMPEWFREWHENDYSHLQKAVSGLEKSVAWIKGSLYVVVPLLMALLIIGITLAINLI